MRGSVKFSHLWFQYIVTYDKMTEILSNDTWDVIIVTLASRPQLLLINGPNLNRLGTRRPEIYGSTTLADVVQQVQDLADRYDVQVVDFQSNHEGEIIDFLQREGPNAVGIIINPGALGHYGLALRDCLEDIARFTIEVHISNVHRREVFRHHLVLSPVVAGQVVGLGTDGYLLAAEYILKRGQQDDKGGN